jgi:cysteine desulfurase
MGRSDTLTRASLRFGLGRFNTAEDIDVAVAHAAETVRRLRGSSWDRLPACRGDST